MPQLSSQMCAKMHVGQKNWSQSSAKAPNISQVVPLNKAAAESSSSAHDDVGRIVREGAGVALGEPVFSQ
jgi:hypothetical protein